MCTMSTVNPAARHEYLQGKLAAIESAIRAERRQHQLKVAVVVLAVVVLLLILERLHDVI